MSAAGEDAKRSIRAKNRVGQLSARTYFLGVIVLTAFGMWIAAGASAVLPVSAFKDAPAPVLKVAFTHAVP